MTIKLASLKADTTKEEQGDLIPIPELPGVRLRVRSLHFPLYVTARDAGLRRLTKRYGSDIPEAELAKLVGTLYARYILLGWEGFDEPFSPELAEELLRDPGYRDLRGHVAWAAAQVGQGAVEFLEDAAKN